jgi:BirA family transcriptional regulator, biotin operon repressor / biotin---[acetyl-CoA-carboxylase] ligase
VTVKEAEPAPAPPLAGGGWGEGARQAGTMLSRARALRQDSTPAERRLRQKLRNHLLSCLKFRRQVPLGPYIADFYCATAHLVIELDGISHIDAARDAVRDKWMGKHGIRVLRIPNREVLANLEFVLVAIEQAARRPPPPGPLPQGEGEDDCQPLRMHHV